MWYFFRIAKEIPSTNLFIEKTIDVKQLFFILMKKTFCEQKKLLFIYSLEP